MIKLRRIRWAGHWHIGGRGEVYTGFWWGNLREKEHLDNPGVDGRIISRWIFRSEMGYMDWINLARYRER
jgi:hypothetical protein